MLAISWNQPVEFEQCSHEGFDGNDTRFMVVMIKNDTMSTIPVIIKIIILHFTICL